MRYVMRQKLFSLTDSFTIKDEYGRDAFSVKGRLFSFGHKLSFCDTSGNELAFIKQKLMTLKPSYEIYSGEELYAVIRKRLFTLFNCRFDIEVVNGDTIDVQGDIFDHEYTIEREGKLIATVSKKWFSFTDTYGIEICPGEDDVLVLSIAVAIDLMCHDDHN